MVKALKRYIRRLRRWCNCTVRKLVKDPKKNMFFRFIKIHPLTTAFIIVVSVFSLLIATSESTKTLILGYVENEPTAFATLFLAFITAMAILKEPISKTFNRPVIDFVPTKIMKYPEDKNHEISVFATLPPSGSLPVHIWIRLYLENRGRSVAKDVYVKIISVSRTKEGQDVNSSKLTPFNPFKLRWVSSDKITEIKLPWYGSALKGATVQRTVDGDLVKNESEYVNMCTFVGAYYLNDEKLCLCPVLVPGLPEDDGNGNIVGEGHVAGMNSDILKVKSKINETSKVEKFTWEKLQFRFDAIIGGSNFRTKKCSFIVKCSIEENVPPSAKAGNCSRYADLQNNVKISIELIK